MIYTFMNSWPRSRSVGGTKFGVLVGSILAIGLVIFPLAGAGVAAPPDLISQINQLSTEYHTMLRVAKPEQGLGVALGKVGETWAAVAESLVFRQQRPAASDFLTKALTNYRINLAQSQDQLSIQLAGMNLLFQSVDVFALSLAEINRDSRTQEAVRNTENRTLEIVGQSGPGLPALAAISGSVLTLLALAAEQIDQHGRMVDLLETELDRRRQVDGNIGNLKDTGPTERFLLLANNHVHGIVSVVQIIGLTLDPGIRPKLATVENQLIKVKDSPVEMQILAGAKALAESSFLVGPLLNNIGAVPGKNP